MNADRRNKLEKVRRRLYAIKRQTESLKLGDREAFVSDLESAVASIEEALRKIDFSVVCEEATEPIDEVQMVFEAWWKNEMRKGIYYASVADAASA
jgi:hypothetical protein